MTGDALSRTGESATAWQHLARKALKGEPLTSLVRDTSDGIEISPLYVDGEATEIVWAEASVVAVRSLIAAADPAAANAALLGELEGGAESVLLQLAAPGQPGVAFADPNDIGPVFENVFLDAAGVWLRGPSALGADGVPLLHRIWEARSVGPADRRGGFGLDPLGWLAAGAIDESGAGGVRNDAPGCLALLADNPQVSAFTASGLAYHEAGATEAQELAAMLATCLAYLEDMAGDGNGIAKAERHIDIELAADADLFVSTAKLRAARLLWTRLLECLGVEGARARLHVQTSARMMAREDVPVNMLRTTAAALAAGIGGADSITVLPYTHALGRPDGLARRIARNIPIILRDESYVGSVADPSAGSGAIEHLTGALCAEAWVLFQEIEKVGGMADALRTGLLRGWIARAAADRAASVDDGSVVQVGASRFVNPDDTPPETQPWEAEPRLDTAFSLH